MDRNMPLEGETYVGVLSKSTGVLAVCSMHLWGMLASCGVGGAALARTNGACLDRWPGSTIESGSAKASVGSREEVAVGKGDSCQRT